MSRNDRKSGSTHGCANWRFSRLQFLSPNYIMPAPSKNTTRTSGNRIPQRLLYGSSCTRFPQRPLKDAVPSWLGSQAGRENGTPSVLSHTL
jgi:hypothetical protein